MSDITIQDVFQRFYPPYLDHNNVSVEQQKVANAVLFCKTPGMGMNTAVCPGCNNKLIHYNSCRNRHCPMCQALATDKWIDLQQENVLDVPYFHAVFTIPEQLYSLTYSNQKTLYDTMYHAVSKTLMELSKDSKHLGGFHRFYLCTSYMGL